jgi:hypothetical protein
VFVIFALFLLIIAVLSTYIHILRLRLAKTKIVSSQTPQPVTGLRPILKEKQVTFSNIMDSNNNTGNNRAGETSFEDYFLADKISMIKSSIEVPASPSSTMGLKRGKTGFDI